MTDAELILKALRERLDYVRNGGVTHYGWHLPSHKEQTAGMLGEIWGLEYAVHLCEVAIRTNHLTYELTGKLPSEWRGA